MISFIIRSVATLIFHSEWFSIRKKLQFQITLLRDHSELTPPLIARQILVTAEDRRHGKHAGYDLRAIARAIFRRYTSSRKEGASTIEQQIVRVITGRFEKTLRRKIREIFLASLVAHEFPKSVTPTVYLSIGYYGWRMNNYLQACRRLRICPNNLSIEEAAAIVARLKYPQPHLASEKRLLQITRRKEHLAKLYAKHVVDGTYLHLGLKEHGQTVRCRREFAASLKAASYS